MSDKLKDAGKRGVQSQSIVDARNYPVTQFFCGVNTEWLGIKVKKSNRKKLPELITMIDLIFRIIGTKEVATKEM